jgi:hypothetical protein
MRAYRFVRCTKEYAEFEFNFVLELMRETIQDMIAKGIEPEIPNGILYQRHPEYYEEVYQTAMEQINGEREIHPFGKKRKRAGNK